MKKLLIPILILLSLAGISQQHYVPTRDGIVVNTPQSPAQGFSLDARSQKRDSIYNTRRAFVDTAEVNRWFNTSKYREGLFPIQVNTGGTLSNGKITGGTNTFWYYRGGTSDANLVQMIGIEVMRSISALRTMNNIDTAVAYRVESSSGVSEFYYDPFDVSTPDDSIMVVVNGTHRYKRYYENYVLANWFGFNTANSSAANQFFLQKAINFAIANLKTPKVKVLGGLYNVKDVVIYKKTGPSEYDFVTCTIEGAAPTFDVSTSLGPITVFNNADTASFILGVEKGRNVLIKDIAFNGPNAINPTVAQVVEWTDAQWANGSRNNRYSPSALIPIDIFSANVAVSDRYPGMSAWYTNSSGGGSSQVTIDGVALRSCNVGIMVSPNGTTQNCDNIYLTNSSASNLKNLWATGQTQSRNNSINNLYSYGGIQYVINCVDYGSGQGSAPNIIKGNIAGGTKYLYNIGSAFSGMDITDSYIESIWSLGKSNILPVTFTNTQVSLMIPDATSTFTSPLLAEGSMVNFVGGTLEWFDNLYNVGFPFKVTALNFNGTTLRGNMPINYQFDRTTYNGVRIFNGYADGVIWDKNLVSIDLSNEAHQPILPGTVIAGSYGESYRSIEKTKVQQIFTENHSLTINTGSHTASFKSTNPYKYQVNDALMTTTTVTYSNSIYSAASTSLGYVYSIGGDSTITLHYVPYGLSGVTSYDINIYRIPLFVPRTIGNIVSGSDTIRNVVYETASFRVGDRIKSFDKNGTSSYGIVAGTYVKYIDLANGKIAISIPANQTATGIVFEDAHLYKEAKSSGTDLGNAALPEVWAPGDNIWNDHSLAANDSIALWQCVVAGKYTGTIPTFISIKPGSSYTLPIAQPSTLGGIKPDNTTITVDPVTGIATSTGGSGTPPTFYPESYGGVVNSPSTDNSVSINAAITAANAAFLTTGLKQRVTLAAGTWWLRNSYRDTAVVNKPGGIVMLPGVLLQGAGVGATMVKASPAPAGATFNSSTFITNSKFRNVITGTNANDCGIMDLTVNGNITNQINYNINPYFTPQDGLAYDSCSDGIRLINSANVTIDNVKLDSITGYSVSMINSPNVYINHIYTGWNINGGAYFYGYCQGGKLINSKIMYSSCDNVRLRASGVTIENNEIAWSKFNPDIAGANFAGIYIENLFTGAASVTGILIKNNRIHDNSSFAVDAFNYADTNRYTYPGMAVDIDGNYIYRNANAGVQVQMQRMFVRNNTIELNGADSTGTTDPVGTASMGVVGHGVNSNSLVVQNNTFLNSNKQLYAYGSTSGGSVPLFTFTDNTVLYGKAIFNTTNYNLSAKSNVHGNSWTDSVGHATISDMYMDSVGSYHLKPSKADLSAPLTGQLFLHGGNDVVFAGVHAQSASRGFYIGNIPDGLTGMTGILMDNAGDYSSSSSTFTANRNFSLYDFQTASKVGGWGVDHNLIWGPNYTNRTFTLNGDKTQTDLLVLDGTNAGRSSLIINQHNATGNASLFLQNSIGTSLTDATGIAFIAGPSTAGSLLGVSYANRVFFTGNGSSLAGVAVGTIPAIPLTLSTGNTKRYEIDGSGNQTFILGSDATNDMYYRNASGYFTRLPAPLRNGMRLNYVSGNYAWTDTTASVSVSSLTDTLNNRFNTLDTTWHSRTFTSTTATTFNADTIRFTAITGNELIEITAKVKASKSTGESYNATKTMFFNCVSGIVTDGTGSDGQSDQFIPSGGLTGYTFSIVKTNSSVSAGGIIVIQVTSIAGTINGKVTYDVDRFKN